MKKVLFKSILILTTLCAALNLSGCAAHPIFAQTAAPQSIISNFGKDPQTQRNFTWITSMAEKSGEIEFCAQDEFKSFGSGNIVRIKAKNYETKTDLDSRVIHKVELVNLRPGTEYVYRVGSADSFSPQGVFRTAGQETDGFTFINITDTQGATAKDYEVWKNTLDQALGKFPKARFLIHTGDMVDDGQLINQWDLFSNAVVNELLRLPMVPVVGNHEIRNQNKTNYNAKNFTDRFNFPIEQDTGAPPGTVYSFDYGNAHIAIMNTECESKNLKKQADWLRQDMTRTDKLWKIVALHRGPYGATYNTTDIRRAWTPVFDELGVDLVLQGHDHNYVRSYIMKNGIKAAGQGTLYITGNTGGVKFYKARLRSWQEVDLQPNTQMYIAVTVIDSKMTINAYDVKNTLRDSFTLEK